MKQGLRRCEKHPSEKALNIKCAVRRLSCPNRQEQKRTNVADKKVDEDGNVYISPQILGISPQPE